VTTTYAGEPEPGRRGRAARRESRPPATALLNYRTEPGGSDPFIGGGNSSLAEGDPFFNPGDPFMSQGAPFGGQGFPFPDPSGTALLRGAPRRHDGGRSRRARMGLLPVAALAFFTAVAVLGVVALVRNSSGPGKPPQFGGPNPMPPPASAGVMASGSALPTVPPLASGTRMTPVQGGSAVGSAQGAATQGATGQGGTGQGAAMQTSPAPVTVVPSAVVVTPSVAMSGTSSTSGASGATGTTATTGGARAVAVTYSVFAVLSGGFEAEIEVTNNGSEPISGWQIIVALPHDHFIAVSNASGYASHHVLVLSPSSSMPSIAPGTTLHAFFVARGTETTPELCAFNNTACG
jgi:hypothetical protein